MTAATRDARIDAYIAAARPFAQPILDHLRLRLHAACPEVEETIRWGRSSFPIAAGRSPICRRSRRMPR
ncbi:hypothetical protein [uncultured Sphingomonas sp.]|uniref:hypothetical protein n=1 Tax=uncultured Sphingomonas sp. TaxID=158754 RepID=UPI0035CB5CB7